MNNSDSNRTPDDDWDERGDLVWNEFDWEGYLREQDQAIVEYWRCYDEVGQCPERIDEVARRLGWDPNVEAEPEGLNEDEAEDDFASEGLEPYTVQRNPVFIATRALFASIQAALEQLGVDPKKLPPAQAIPLAGALRRAELAAVLGVSALDMGDHALGISQLKRALADLNQALAHLPAESADTNRHWHRFRAYALPRLFDLREIWLRVVHECRDELDHERDDDSAI